MSAARWRAALTLVAALVAFFLLATRRHYPASLAAAAGAAVGGLFYFAWNTVMRLRRLYRHSLEPPVRRLDDKNGDADGTD